MHSVNIFWFRRDLRLHDNAGLYHALKEGGNVIPVFIFDKYILDKLSDKSDRRVEFIHKAIVELQEKCVGLGSSLQVYYGYPEQVFSDLLDSHQISNVYTNHDYEPYAKERDGKITELLKRKSVSLFTYKDHVIFEKNEILKDDTRPYTVFTPYSKKWLSTLTAFHLKSYPVEKYQQNFYHQNSIPIPTLEEIGFIKTQNDYPPPEPANGLIETYDKTRNYPGKPGTSRLGVHLRFGTISIRQVASIAKAKNATFLNELIWRDFYQAILWHFPHVGNHKAFKPAYEKIAWRNDETEFQKWCEGNTGYPIVDAGMRELNETGFLHNRVRMIVASFLVKHLLIDWRWGEAYFAEKLLDFDLASNNGGWQWASGSGCDSAPYFRIFNPYLQTKKFDAELSYIKKWVPEFQEFNYPKPMVDHDFARKRALEVFGAALKVAT